MPRFDSLREGFRRNWEYVLFWAVLVAFVAAGIHFHWKGEVIAAVAVLWGIATHIFGMVFSSLGTWVSSIPVMGPMVVKVFAWPLFLLINGLAFFTSLVGVNLGRGRQVFEARVAATILTVGILIGFILGKLF
jgi:hypothetical protein